MPEELKGTRELETISKMLKSVYDSTYETWQSRTLYNPEDWRLMEQALSSGAVNPDAFDAMGALSDSRQILQASDLRQEDAKVAMEPPG